MKDNNNEEKVREEIRYHMRCIAGHEEKICEHANAIEELQVRLPDELESIRRDENEFETN